MCIPWLMMQAILYSLVHEDIFGHLRHLCLKNNSPYNYIHGLDIIIRLVRWCECVRPKSNICSQKRVWRTIFHQFFGRFWIFLGSKEVFKTYLYIFIFSNKNKLNDYNKFIGINAMFSSYGNILKNSKLIWLNKYFHEPKNKTFKSCRHEKCFLAI